jgi:hypothetical protein
MCLWSIAAYGLPDLPRGQFSNYGGSGDQAYDQGGHGSEYRAQGQVIENAEGAVVLRKPLK